MGWPKIGLAKGHNRSRAGFVVLAGAVGGPIGPRKLGCYFACWYGLKLVRNRSSSGKELSKRGGCDGQQFWHAVQFGRLLRPSLASEWAVVLMGTFRAQEV